MANIIRHRLDLLSEIMDLEKSPSNHVDAACENEIKKVGFEWINERF
jgi:hypothetical protein